MALVQQLMRLRRFLRRAAEKELVETQIETNEILIQLDFAPNFQYRTLSESASTLFDKEKDLKVKIQSLTN